ncbi:MAG: glutathione S-transferase family protein [Gammaproteobacteria bacterium]
MASVNAHKIVLVGWNRSPYARRVAVSMRHYGIEFEQRMQTAWDHYDDVRTVNPIVKIPALVTEEGDVIIESAAILDYLDCRVGPERALMPPPSPARDAVRRVVALATAIIDKGRELRYEVHLRPRELRYESFVERWSAQIESALASLNELVQSPFAAGDYFTQADVTLGVMYDMYRPMHPELLPIGKYPKLDALADKYHAMPVFMQSPLEPVS